MILPVIMAGGSGTRLWPLSRGNYPKQFLALDGSNHTMLQQTISRLSGIDHAPAMLICNEEHRFIAAEQVRQLNVEHSGIFLEPVGRNTAPAIALAAFKAVENKQDPLLLVLAADHVIENTAAFQQSVSQAAALAEQGKLVTFGIVGNKPETGYGYIKRGEQYQAGFVVDRFVEKPDLATANTYIESGDYYWNSGMFLFKASRYLQELKAFRPDIYTACEQAMQVQNDDMDFVRVDKAAFEQCPDESIDYAVMEHTKDAVVVPMDAGWNDVGGFEALWEVSQQDENGNAFKGDVKAVDTKNTLVFGEDKLVATVGVENLVIVNTKDAVLVAHKNESQKVKTIVQQLKNEQRPEVKFHREVYRPWGKYDSVDCGERFQVKRITVKPGAKLSVQMHHHRAEHWIVVSGTAKVHLDGQEQYLTENESVYIPITAVHALENPGKVDLELIEVQSGSYLGEDDIVRFEDRYGRS
ncbi:MULTISPECIES: mannose-1-phosphate guanylyltransferase/mannose-6-phosphate isomerase [unclassified Pseudoalteromonas]|uniref:mannose-1-phosphate guanylyltransferase/mannose-6-phosphate isomerase n=1 Tax=unclassified Pseudoalteromonas TaxID=194690 RepID=UPI00110944B6|nr:MULTISPECIES: mannose-1-phosphate guanylyltransferase/mannose-6-phosphate isomerase [unclassified Pseudoalteromonas]TMN81306.1 mannose-1-phosphate guanylyltransferase/mannose-6-phosphate isomerase [Pseudoalteromonas sp. S410]TMN89287.1 mannose-1-phosphate guanylyltransferase/mannose-6-phosphate isomerase [Pseudoalteromonas sp. S408]TMN95065.1 mannose-1-phosphate guanylyltransferase/mannose-6-phosphate isomerase [Pseudoalteromonas sp. S407]TMN96532.1 mannose-1-phosphate guanylyltransferase/ma